MKNHVYRIDVENRHSREEYWVIEANAIMAIEALKKLPTLTDRDHLNPKYQIPDKLAEEAGLDISGAAAGKFGLIRDLSN